MAEDGQGEDRLIMFATEVNIKLLGEAQTIYVNDTFQTCPSLFYQFFTVHAFKNGRQFPLVYTLLPNLLPHNGPASRSLSGTLKIHG